LVVLKVTFQVPLKRLATRKTKNEILKAEE